MATNHVYDKGTEGILQSVDYWETSHPEVTLLGIHKDQETAKTVQTVEIKGITIALLNYTCLINGNKQDEIPTGMVDYANEVKMRADIQQARATADLVMVYLHTGEEYATEPSAEQISLLKMFLEEGVDITFCSHPHVLQGYETLQNDSGKQMLVYYSLGNFISAQKEPQCLLGGMADIKIAIDGETGGLSIQESQLIPLVTHYNYEDNIYTVYRLEDYTEELAASHSVHQESSEAFTLDSLQSMAERALTANYKIWE
jgi:poly-gamma-glutamate synthesis protein (capsule biosynthesis protein)